MTSRAEIIQSYIDRKEPKNPEWSDIEQQYYDYLETKVPSSINADIAYTIHNDSTQCEILQSLLIADCPIKEIVEAFAIPEEAINIYIVLFFDVSMFKTKLEKISYVENYENNFGRELMTRSLSIGYEYILYTYGNVLPKLNVQKDLIRKIFMSSAYKAMNMNYASMTSATMNKAIEHGKLMLKAFEALEKVNADSGSENYDLLSIVVSKPEDKQIKLDGELL